LDVALSLSGRHFCFLTHLCGTQSNMISKRSFLLLMCLFGCAPQGPKSALSFAPAQPQFAVWMPRFASVIEGTDDFLTRVTQGAGAQLLERMREGVTKQLGIDVLDAKAYAEIGLDVERGVLIFGDKFPILVLPVSDATRAREAIQRWLAKADGADTIQEEKIEGGVKLLTALRPFGTEKIPSLHYAFVGKFVLLSKPDGKAELLQAIARRRSQPTLDVDKWIARTQLGNILVHVHGPSGVPAFASLDLSSRGFFFNSLIEIEKPEVKAAFVSEATWPLTEHLGEGAVVVALTNAARLQSMQALRAYPFFSSLIDRTLVPMRTAMHVDLEKQVLPLLAGPFDLAIYPEDLSQLYGHEPPQGLGHWLDIFQVAVVAKIKDREAMLKLLQTVQKDLKKQGMPLVQRKEKYGDAVATIFQPQGNWGWAIYKDYYVYGVGEARLHKALQMLVRNDKPLSSAFAESLAGKLAKRENTSLVVVRGGVMADMIDRVTHDKREGNVGEIFNTAIHFLRSLNDVTLALTGEEQGLRVEIRQSLQ
jgi:hypothetical protein